MLESEAPIWALHITFEETDSPEKQGPPQLVRWKVASD